uniref:Uncharacterized protein n=1 Tax=viral metagenome TaxID=1070528 RepID=A0A6H2A4V8_9ZZZZ
MSVRDHFPGPWIGDDVEKLLEARSQRIAAIEAELAEARLGVERASRYAGEFQGALSANEETLGKVCDDRDNYKSQLAEARAEVERLRGLVETAYNEGFNEGMNEVQRYKGGASFYDSKSRQALEES